MRYNWETLSSGLGDYQGTSRTFNHKRKYQIVTSVEDFLPLPRSHKTCCESIKSILVLKEIWVTPVRLLSPGILQFLACEGERAESSLHRCLMQELLPSSSIFENLCDVHVG
jgi:hypothetical protein